MGDLVDTAEQPMQECSDQPDAPRSKNALSLELIAMPRRPRRRNPRPLLYDTGLERRRTACATKERYASEAEARSIALMNAPPGRRASTTPYHCDVCDGWHLTSI